MSFIERKYSDLKYSLNKGFKLYLRQREVEKNIKNKNAQNFDIKLFFSDIKNQNFSENFEFFFL